VWRRAAPQWAVAVGLGKYYAAMKREEIDESLLRHLTADHLALIGVSDGHERFAVLQSIHSTYGVDPRDSATQLLTMQIEHASLAANRAAVQVAEAVQRVQQQRQTEPQTELQQQQSKTESNDAVAA
jgi:hypothetical protein